MPIKFSPLPEISERDIQRFWEKVEFNTDPNTCWQWLGGELGGYPRFDWSRGRDNKRSLLGHRLSYYMHHKSDPEKIIVQTCGNKMCVNPNHLEAREELTNKQNLQKGDKIGELIFLNRVEAHPDRPTANFLCDCGKEFTSRIDAIKSGKTKSCGCKRGLLNMIAKDKGYAPIELTKEGIKKIPTLVPKDYKAFWSKVNLQARIDVCWDWMGGNNGRYGYFALARGMYKANRIAYSSFYKKDPSDMHVLHTCDNPKCCNPHHLFLGTHEDNMKDMVEKGRHGSKKY